MIRVWLAQGDKITLKKPYKPQFTQMFHAIAFAIAGFQLRCCIGNIEFSISVYSWCQVEKFHVPEGLYEILAICNLYNIFNGLFSGIKNTGVEASCGSWYACLKRQIENNCLNYITAQKPTIEPHRFVQNSEWHMCTIWNCTQTAVEHI